MRINGDVAEDKERVRGVRGVTKLYEMSFSSKFVRIVNCSQICVDYETS